MGKIPSNWLLTKNRYGFIKYNNGKNEKNDTPVLSLTTKGIKVKTNLNYGKSAESYIGHQLVEKGDVVFTPRDFDQTPILSDVSKYNGCISNLYIVDKVKKEVLNYFINYYWHGLKYSVDYFKNFSHGIRYSFNRFQFDEIPLLIPPISEQKIIVRYLDNKNEQIDKLIYNIKKKIELLKQKRTSLINHYVTKGLDPKVDMKETAVKWIGKIPKHWKLQKLKHIVNKRGLIRGPFGGSLKIDTFVPKGYKVYEQKNAIYDNFSLGSAYINDKKYTELKRFSIQQNDILMSCSGTIGKTSLVRGEFEKGIINQALLIIRLEFPEKTLPKYIQTIFSSSFFQEQIIDNSQGGAMKNLVGIDIFKNVKIPLPNSMEQLEILSYIDNKCLILDELITKEKLKVEKLKEYLRTLTSSVVTGKVRIIESMV